MTNAEAALHDVARDAADCQRCPLYKIGTQTVFGTGPPNAPVMLIGEQPGDVEDRQGLPFVGPAGRMLDLPDQDQRKAGAVLTFYQYLGEHFKVGIGYNFTDFSDDPTDLTYDDHGVFFNLVGSM